MVLETHPRDEPSLSLCHQNMLRNVDSFSSPAQVFGVELMRPWNKLRKASSEGYFLQFHTKPSCQQRQIALSLLVANICGELKSLSHSVKSRGGFLSSDVYGGLQHVLEVESSPRRNLFWQLA